jgi:predicted transporter
MFGILNVLLGLVQLVVGVLMLIFTVAFGVEHPIPAALGTLFLLVGVVFPIWATLSKSYRKEVRRQQLLRSATTRRQAR